MKRRVPLPTWRKKLTSSFLANGETWDDVEANTMTNAEMDVAFDDDFGSSNGCPFTVWTKNRVYFPTTYDGMESVESVARHPDGQPTQHIGGE